MSQGNEEGLKLKEWLESQFSQLQFKFDELSLKMEIQTEASVKMEARFEARLETMDKRFDAKKGAIQSLEQLDVASETGTANVEQQMLPSDQHVLPVLKGDFCDSQKQSQETLRASIAVLEEFEPEVKVCCIQEPEKDSGEKKLKSIEVWSANKHLAVYPFQKGNATSFGSQNSKFEWLETFSSIRGSMARNIFDPGGSVFISDQGCLPV